MANTHEGQLVSIKVCGGWINLFESGNTTLTFALRFAGMYHPVIRNRYAEVAQLVERQLPKL